MQTIIESGTSTLEKVMYVVLGLIVVSALISLPFMVADKQERLEQAWQEQGCQMYDTEEVAKIPAKCNMDFVDHYKPQAKREQPSR